ncbi:MAG: hypothetical protein ABL966_09760 [Acidimicrobiales bacterium]
MRRVRGLLLAVLAATAAMTVVASTPAPARPTGVPDDRRVLVLTVPGLTWKDLEAPELSNLRALLDESAIANIATRVTSVVSQPGEAYLTMGAGTRAVAPKEVAGLSFQADEAFGLTTAGDEHARQHGTSVDAQVVSLGWTLLVSENEAAEFGGTIGALGQALDDAGVDRGVIANADGADPLVPGEPIHREAALALADATGAVPCGQVGSVLLTTDDAAPFGVRLDEGAVLDAYDRCSTPGSVVLIEASDLRRALAFRPRATPELADAARRAALASTDALAAALLTRLDLERDAVVVVAPSTQPTPGLGVLGVRAAEVPPGYLTSGNTRRAGYVLLTDLAPSIAHLTGVELDEASIEGRAVEPRPGPALASDRRAELVDGEAAARFRDRMLEPVVLTVVISVSALALAAALVLIGGWRRHRRWLAPVALVLLALPSLTYLAALLPFYDWGAVAYWLFLVLGSLLVGVTSFMLRGRWLLPLAIGYGLLVGVVTLSIVGLGSRLQLATVFGDSPIVAGRFTGINNVTFAYFFLAGSMLACIAVDWLPGPRGRRLMVAILGGVLLIDVAPMWGADVGGALAGLPALVLVATGLGEWKVRWRTVGLIVLGTAALVAGLAWLDLSRESADRSHLGRLFERIGSDGTSGLTTVVERKLAVNLRSLTESTWRFIFGPLAVAGGLMVWRGRDWAHAVAAAFPPLRRALPGLIALAALGYGANDSGIAVPAAMLAVAVPGLVYLACRVDPPPTTEQDA